MNASNFIIDTGYQSQATVIGYRDTHDPSDLSLEGFLAADKCHTCHPAKLGSVTDIIVPERRGFQK